MIPYLQIIIRIVGITIVFQRGFEETPSGYMLFSLMFSFFAIVVSMEYQLYRARKEGIIGTKMGDVDHTDLSLFVFQNSLFSLISGVGMAIIFIFVF